MTIDDKNLDPIGEEYNRPIPQEFPDSGSSQGMIYAALVTKDGGASGGAAAECTYTYTVKALDDATILDTLVTPQVPRLHYIEYWYAGEARTTPAATTSRYALITYDSGGNLVLLQCFGELPKDDICA